MPGFILCIAGDWWSSGWAGHGWNGVLALGCGTLTVAAYALVIRFTPFLDVYDVAFLEETLKLNRVPGFRAWAARVRRV